MDPAFTITRINQQEYELTFNDGKHRPTRISLNTQDEISNKESIYEVVHEIGEEILQRDESEPLYLEYMIKGKKWWVSNDHFSNFPNKILKFFHLKGDDGIRHLIVSDWRYLDVDDFMPTEHLSRGLQKEQLPALSKSQLIRAPNLEERKRNILAIHELNAETSFAPFHELSVVAFQRFEEDFVTKDHIEPQESTTILQLDGHRLFLVERHKAGSFAKEINQTTVKTFVEQAIKECGKEKFDYICHLYKLDFNKMIQDGSPLTPEHVYRMNIGFHNIEIDDLESLFPKMKTLHSSIQKLISNPNVLDIPLNEFLKSQESNFSKMELRGIAKALESYRGKNPKVQDLQKWLGQFAGFESIRKLPPNELNLLMAAFDIHEYDLPHICSGREIYGHLSGGYALADQEIYKPWIDQQELLQTMPRMQKAKSWNEYYEILSHIVCKKHLFREHPVKGCKAGAILPAPKSSDGKQHWYIVSQAVHNGYGKVCYTLQPLGNDSSLPTIKLYRSTAADPYAIFGKKTIRSDVNPLNPAAYEGMERTEHYETPLINSQTIPLWVAYLEQAKKSLNHIDPADVNGLSHIEHSLDLATKELRKSELHKVRMLSFEEVIKKHDGIINTLYSIGKIDPRFFHRIRNFAEGAGPSFTLTAEEKRVAIEKEKKNALELKKLLLNESVNALGENYSDALKIQLVSEIDRLLTDLTDHVITSKAKDRFLLARRIINKDIHSPLLLNKKEAKTALNSGNNIGVLKHLQKWSADLEDIAKAQKEDVASKQPADIAFVGHSLGGGYAQAFFCHHLVNQNRVPCPASSCSVAAFDAPGCSQQDNEAFKEMLKRHHGLFADLSIKFKIYHQHEQNDPVSSGHIHLGSSNTIKEAANLLSQIEFEGNVFRKLPNAKYPPTAGANTVHATQFLGGIEHVDYEKESFDPYMLGLMEKGEEMELPIPESAGEAADKFRYNTWEYPLSPVTANKIQSNRIVYNIARLLSGPTWVDHEEHMQALLDGDGNLAVNEHGLMY